MTQELFHKAEMDIRKKEHLRLAGIIKGVHADLRRKYRKCEQDFDLIWKDHCKNKSVLSEYAQAMFHLAQKHWSKLPLTRIDWCRDTILDYFYKDGMKKAVEKEDRRHKYKIKIEPISDSDRGFTGDLSKVNFDNDKNFGCSSSGTNDVQQVYLCLPIDDKIRILDVGSCFNPLAAYEEFLAVGIDISPANSNVHSCDFLHLQTTQPLNSDTRSLESYLSSLTSPMSSLPQSCFHVVVFSLLLEYFPSPHQRWMCCEKAYELLMVNGLLLIVTPDSHKQHRNLPMIKSWKTAIESIGFVRWRYIKLTHLHCMAFRKIKAKSETSVVDLTGNPELLYIPQDFHDIDEKSDSHYTEADHDFFYSTIGELPSFVEMDD